MKLNVMVTATGSAVAQGIMKSIKLSGLDCDIITTDAQPYAAGLYRGKVGYLTPLAKSPDFIDKIIKVCNTENVDCIFIGTDYELLKFAENKERIEKETNARVIVSPPEIIKIADDKWLTHKFLVDNSLPHIPSALHYDVDDLVEREGFPLIIKPRIGDSSKGIRVVNDYEELRKRLASALGQKGNNEYLSQETEPFIQKYLPDEKEEYTSTTLTFDGWCYGVISMNREMRFGGHTTKAIVRDFPDLNKYIKKLAETLNAFGPCNFQSRLSEGVPRVFEINCRFSGTTPLCAQMGFNTVAATIRHVVLKDNIGELTHKNGVLLRYFNEVFIPHEEIEKMGSNGYVQQPYSEINKVL